METAKYFEVNGHKSTTYQNVWDVAETVLRETGRDRSAQITKEEELKINDLSFQHKKQGGKKGTSN